MINISNYEEWFLDYSEGNLTDVQLEQLKRFLYENPVLNEEFKELEFVKLEKVQVPFPHKNMLKKSLNIEEIQGVSDFEVLTIKKMEGDMSPKEEKELDDILKYNPHLQKEYNLLFSTKLVPKRSVIYNDKQKLKKQTTRVLPLWLKYAASIAAVFVLMIFAVKVLWYEKPEQIIVKNQTEIETKSSSIKTEIIKNNTNIENIDLVSNGEDHRTAEEYLSNSLDKTSNIKAVGTKAKKTQKTSFLKTNIVKNSKVDRNIINRRLERIELVAVDRIKTKNINISQPYNKNDNVKIGRKPVAFIHSEKYDNDIAYNNIEVLTPKQFFIKKIKTGLDVDDKNYDEIDVMSTISAVVNTTGFTSVKVEEKNNRKEIAFSIGAFSFSKKYYVD